MANDDDDIKPTTKIDVKKDESILWRDGTDVLENLRTNLEFYLNDIAQRRFRYVTPSHKKNAEKMLAKIQELSQLEPTDPAFILGYGGLVEIVKSIDIRAKDSFLKRLLDEAKEELNTKTDALTKHMSGEFGVARALRKQGPTKDATISRLEKDIQLMKVQTDMLSDENKRLSDAVSELEAKLTKAVELQRETSQKLQAAGEREQVRETEKARDVAMMGEYAGFREANVELRKQVEQLQREKKEVQQELAGIDRLGLIGKNADLEKADKELKQKIANLEQELSGARKLLDKVKEENSVLSDTNKSLLTHVEKVDVDRHAGVSESLERENQLKAELKREQENSSKWRSAFEGLMKVVNTLLVKMGREPLPFLEGKPEATVDAMEERNKGIRIKAPTGVGLFQDSKSQTAEPSKTPSTPERKLKGPQA